MRQNPSVSVIIPVHNRASKIAMAVDSVRAQTYPNWEAIVVDDGSTDGSHRVVMQLAEGDDRIALVRHSSRRGAQAARNTGIHHSRAKWIAFLDSDDQWLPESLDMRLEHAETGGFKIVHSECYVIQEDGEKALFGVPPVSGSAYRDLLAGPGPMFQGLLVAKEALERIGYLDEHIISYQEWDTAIRLARHYPFGFVDKPTFVYDCRGTDTISKNKLRTAKGYEQVFRKHLVSIVRCAGPRAVSDHYHAAAFLYHSAGERSNGRYSSVRAALWWPFHMRIIRRLGKEVNVLAQLKSGEH
jgi:glycosyltransferase involved in cell wall biosynthesis